MIATPSAPRESRRLDALVRHCVGWQVDELHVLVGEHGLILRGRARSKLARVLAEVEAARLSGLPVVENQMDVS
jgi:hypothetical protein